MKWNEKNKEQRIWKPKPKERARLEKDGRKLQIYKQIWTSFNSINRFI